MFYCDACGAQRGWATNTPTRSVGPCELCGQRVECNDAKPEHPRTLDALRAEFDSREVGEPFHIWAVRVNRHVVAAFIREEDAVNHENVVHADADHRNVEARRIEVTVMRDGSVRQLVPGNLDPQLPSVDELRAQALAKLTEAERAALGITDAFRQQHDLNRQIREHTKAIRGRG